MGIRQRPGGNPVTWERVVFETCEAFGWTVEDVSLLTIRQIISLRRGGRPRERGIVVRPGMDAESVRREMMRTMGIDGNGAVMADVIAGLEAQLSVDSKDVNAGIANARAMMDRLESEMRRLTEEEKKGILATADYASKMNELQAASQRLGAGLQSAFSRSGSAIQGMEAMGRSSGAFSRGMLDISRGVEDFATGGFLGVLNNIPGCLLTWQRRRD
jgi:hypothetical protein